MFPPLAPRLLPQAVVCKLQHHKNRVDTLKRAAYIEPRQPRWRNW